MVHSVQRKTKELAKLLLEYADKVENVKCTICQIQALFNTLKDTCQSGFVMLSHI